MISKILNIVLWVFASIGFTNICIWIIRPIYINKKELKKAIRICYIDDEYELELKNGSIYRLINEGKNIYNRPVYYWRNFPDGEMVKGDFANHLDSEKRRMQIINSWNEEPKQLKAQESQEEIVIELAELN